MGVWGARAHLVPAYGDEIKPPAGTSFSTGLDAALLSGPSSAPGGAVVVTPGGTGVDALTTSNAAGTTFYLLAGTHVLGTAGSPGVFDQITPKAGNTYIGAPGAVLSGQNVNRYAFTQTATGVTIRYLEITGFNCNVEEFVVNHDTGDNWTVQYCNIHNNNGAAVGLGSGAVLQYCWIHHNGQYAFSAFNPPVTDAATCAVQTVLVDHCELGYNGTLSDEFNADGTTTGNGRNGGGKFWDTQDMTVTNNWVHHNMVGIWADTNNVRLRLEANLIEDSVCEGFMYEISYNFLCKANTFRRNGIYKGFTFSQRSDVFPVAAVYISESGGDSAVDATYATCEIVDNRFVDNWGDITLWENADRFCNSVGNTSQKIYKPKGHGATLGICNDPTPKTLTVNTVSGSTLLTATSGTFVFSDDGRAVAGSGIQAGASIANPDTNFQAGYVSATQANMDKTATATATGVSATLAGGTISTTGYAACRWHTQNVLIHGNSFDHNRTRVLATPPPPLPNGYLTWSGSITLGGGTTTGVFALLSQAGSAPSWSPYQGFVIADAIVGTQSNLWRNNAYRGPYTWMPHDTGNGGKTFSTWQSTYAQDVSSTISATAP